MELILPSSYQSIPWKNGSGTLYIIAQAQLEASSNDRWQNLDWQVSTTNIQDKTEFSYLPNFDRLQMVTEGSGLFLDTPSGSISLKNPFETVSYIGELPIVTRLENGSVNVLNLMTKRSKFKGTMLCLNSNETAILQPGIHILYALNDVEFIKADKKSVFISKGSSIRMAAINIEQLSIKSGNVALCSIFAN